MATGFKISMGDWVITNRSLETVADADKAKRDFGKMIVTEKEYPNNVTSFVRYNPNYGSSLNQTEGYFGLTKDDIMGLIKTQLSESIKTYVSQQENRTNLSSAEVIENIDTMVYLDFDNPQKIRFDISGKLANANTSISLGAFSQEI